MIDRIDWSCMTAVYACRAFAEDIGGGEGPKGRGEP